jgi:hypothetical protein
VTPQTLAAYNACALPLGTFNGSSTACPGGVNGGCVPGIGSLNGSTGPQSQITFTPANNGTNNLVTIYACRPTVTPAWLNSPLYPGNSLTPFGSPEPYANGNGPFGGPSATAVTGCIAPGSTPCAGGAGPVPSVTGITCALSGGGTVVNPPFATSAIGVFRPSNNNGSSFLLDSSRANAYVPGSSQFISSFLTGSFNGISSAAGDVGVAGDWTGSGHASVGIYRPSTGQWFLDANRDGVYDAGDYTYTFGGLTAGGNVDTPEVGDWLNTGKTCIGIYRSTGSVWLLDLNCNGTFDNTPTDAFFPFGGIAGDVPVVGAWTGLQTAGVGFKVGVVRKYAPGGVPTGAPFFWLTCTPRQSTCGFWMASSP